MHPKNSPMNEPAAEIPGYLSFCEHKYKIDSVIGEGTFSTVYKARCQRSGAYVAIKAITKTSAPNRVLEELNILKALNGEMNCICLLEILRHQDQIMVIFPLVNSIDFKDFVVRSTVCDIKKYMYSLLKTVKHMHGKGIIHRDIKPGNFLFDIENGEGYLIDFGLAQYEKPRACSPQRPAKPLIFFNSIVTPSKPPGYYERDTRPQMKAPRAGTRGFRAPEVLFRCTNQTRSIDMWSVGVIMLCILTAQYPFFLSTEDVDGLVEIGILFGHAEMRKAAKHYGRTWKSNIPTIGEEGVSFDLLIRRLNPNFEIEDQAIDLLRRLLELINDKRISASEALEHPFFSNIK